MLSLFVSSSFAQGFTIDKFYADITVNQDSSFVVREMLDVVFHESKHGIYRDIPYKYADERGNTIKTPLDILSVVDENGKDWRYKVTRSGNTVHVRIGDPQKYVQGKQTYVISYKVENAILFFEDHDELYWNVTGNDWKAPIRETYANVILSVPNQSKNLWAACFTGGYGSRESACSFKTSRNSGEFLTQKNLGFREGFTIAFGWDKGLVSPPSAWKKFLWLVDLRRNWVFILPIISLIVMIQLWRSKGRDPSVREAVTVQYEPPKYRGNPLSPAEIGTLIDEKLDSRDITATIVGLGVKGYIKIEETKKEGIIFDSEDYYLAKVKEPDGKLSPFEKILMNSIFKGGIPGIMVSDMKNKFYKELDSLKKSLYGELVAKKYFLVGPEKVRNVYISAGVAIAIIASIALSIFLSSPKGLLAGVLTGIPILAFSRAMPAKTRSGSSAYMDVLGFQEFMDRAEKDQLQRMGDKELFSKFLPYAIALDVVDNWAKSFEGIYQEQPQWYVSHAGYRFSPSGFGRSINSATSSLATAMYSAPRGSGVSGGGGLSGGGGFSGGGFGGGGGGSW